MIHENEIINRIPLFMEIFLLFYNKIPKPTLNGFCNGSVGNRGPTTLTVDRCPSQLSPHRLFTQTLDKNDVYC